ncbi:primase-helicase zinc-binding domain-containing protein [Desulfovibrio sp.]|uniref:primase-helicase zinc-binding domain-containing protein n=1 Tax=Desulfovibrio sp. TaxID=885 RepID=UPI0025C628E8|nr:primase-helicase zinc-binding domain-containing protein [Desulfovibrio sp.]
MNSILTFLTAAMKPKGPHEYAGPCPLCGGATNDGFIVWPDRPRGGAFLCRKCGANGDGIAFLMQRDGLGYREACEALGIEPKRTATSSFPARHTHASHRPVRPAQVTHVPPVPPKPEPAVLPCTEWMSSAAAFLAECQHNIEASPEQHVTSNYSDEMLNWMRNMNAGWQAENEMSEQNAKQTEKVLADGRKAIEDALKETPQWQKENLGREKEVKLSATRGAHA